MKVLGIKILSILACIMFAVVAGNASPLFVNNASFENMAGVLDTDCGTDCSFEYVSPSGWIGTGSVGLFRPGSNSGNFGYFDYLPDGDTVFYSNGGTLSQVLAETVEEDFIYTLQVDWGGRNDNFFDPFATIALMIGDDAVIATGTAPTPGNWSTYTATYFGTSSDEGKTIAIQLSSREQGDWDKVRLDRISSTRSTASSIPEPASYLLLAIGIVGVVGLKHLSLG